MTTEAPETQVEASAAAPETTGEDPRMVTLVSRDDQKFELPLNAARLSEMVNNALNLDAGEDDNEDEDLRPVEILRVTAECLEKVVDFLKHYNEDKMTDIPSKFCCRQQRSTCLDATTCNSKSAIFSSAWQFLYRPILLKV